MNPSTATARHVGGRTFRAAVWGFVGASVLMPVEIGGASDTTQGSATRGGTTNLWAGFVEPGVPFFSSVVDARSQGDEGLAENLTARGLVLNLGCRCWVAFDLDLLRVAAIWIGEGVTPVSMSQGSYHEAGRKAPEGEMALPRPAGRTWLANGLYPGWQTVARFGLTDPREPGPKPGDLGRGPLPAGLGRFGRVGSDRGTAYLEYSVRGVTISESFAAEPGGSSGGVVVTRRFRASHANEPLRVVLGRFVDAESDPEDERFRWRVIEGDGGVRRERRDDGLLILEMDARSGPLVLETSFALGGAILGKPGPVKDREPARSGWRRWPETVVTRGVLAPATPGVVVDSIELPVTNPWRRNVRLADLAFLRGGEAAVVTFDGDVWRVSGLSGDLEAVRWRRYATGLHEPLGIAVRDGDIVVHDRNGLWRLRDGDGDGEADSHELISNAFVGTAETREFASGLRVAPDGSFVLAKGGQRGSTLNRHSGCVLRVSSDGAVLSVLGHGFRQPFIGVHPVTGQVTVSDQQGHYTPTTPLHWLDDGRNQYHGFLPLFLARDDHPGPIAAPLAWIPHPINASAAGQVWWTDARAGSLQDALIHLGYYRPEAFVVRVDGRTTPMQAAVMSLTRAFAFPPLAGAVNPADGQLYVVGFQIWGTIAPEVSGMARLRATGLPITLPRTVVPTTEGVLLSFDVPLDPHLAVDPANYSAERWNYQRSADYGSPHFRLDGSKGQDAMAVSSVYLSRDSRSVFIGIPDMRPVMQMRLGWTLASAAGQAVAQNAYFSPQALSHFDPAIEGFEPVAVDLTRREAAEAVSTPVTAEEGRRLSELMGCIACHSIDGSTLGKTGPTWKGLLGREREFADGSRMRVTEDYVRESIREPSRRVVRGFETSDTGMPSYEGVLSDPQIEALVLYIREL